MSIVDVLGRVQQIQADLAQVQTTGTGAFSDVLARAMAGTATSAPAAPAAAAAPATATPGTGEFLWPVAGEVTSDFGPRSSPTAGASSYHRGLDIAAPAGTPIKAAAGGTVSFAGEMGGYGNVVIVDHPGGYQTVYAHQSRLLVHKGQQIAPGQILGAVGSTGVATGPHLHFEVKVNGEAVDPAPYLA